MNEFEPGDIVRLKSGGPKMTVAKLDTDYEGDEYAYCEWFKGATRQSGKFEPQVLESVEEDESG